MGGVNDVLRHRFMVVPAQSRARAMDFERGRAYLALLVAALLLLLLEGVSLPTSLALGGFLQFLLYMRYKRSLLSLANHVW